MKNNIEIYRSPLHKREKSHDVLIVRHGYQKGSVVGSVKIKMTYESYNAVERFTGEIFNDNKWDSLFNLLDLGVLPETDMYISDENKRKLRCENLHKIAFNFIDTLI